MRAFDEVPEVQRDRLAALTGERDRLIGGSADTMYVPGRHRETFMSVLGSFLRTDCFLEIAAPTALHLALPPGEDVLYVDHVSHFSLFTLFFFSFFSHFWVSVFFCRCTLLRVKKNFFWTCLC